MSLERLGRDSSELNFLKILSPISGWINFLKPEDNSPRKTNRSNLVSSAVGLS